MVKELDLKSDGYYPRRFKSCSQFYLNNDCAAIFKHLTFFLTILIDVSYKPSTRIELMTFRLLIECSTTKLQRQQSDIFFIRPISGVEFKLLGLFFRLLNGCFKLWTEWSWINCMVGHSVMYLKRFNRRNPTVLIQHQELVEWKKYLPAAFVA